MKLDKNVGVHENCFSAFEYIKWDKFLNVIAKAKESCKNIAHVIEDHFTRTEKLANIGTGAKRDVGDVHITRYVYYLIVC